jgi:hypothetical protein
LIAKLVSMKGRSGVLLAGVALLFVSCREEPAQKGVPPAISMVEGEVVVDGAWSLTLEQPYSRQVKDGDLLFWRRGSTLFVTVWSHQQASAATCLQEIRKGISANAFDLITESAGPVERFCYRLDEPTKDRRQPAFYGYAVGPKSYVLMAMYFDDPRGLEEAKAIWQSLTVSAE